MLTLFNRAELLVTCDMIRLARVREALLPLTSIISAEPRTCLPRGAYLQLWRGPGARVEYKVYVKRTDLERAKTVL